MPDPTIEAVPASPINYGEGRDAHQLAGEATPTATPRMIVFHVMQGTWEGTNAYFARQRPAKPTSAHYGVSRAGRIAQYVADTDTAYSNGNIRTPQTALIPWLGECIARDINPNDLTLSIECEGMQVGQWVTQAGGIETFAPGSIKTWWVPSEAQYQALLWLVRHLVAQWAIPVDRAHLCRHSDIDHVAKWWCPGLGFPLGRILHDLGGL